MGKILNKIKEEIKEVAEGVAERAGLITVVNAEDGTPVKKPGPVKKSNARKIKRKLVARKVELVVRPLMLSRPLVRITPRRPRVG